LFPAWDAGAYPFVFQRVPEPVSIIAAIHLPRDLFDQRHALTQQDLGSILGAVSN
jgi:hypothetical protein